MLNPLILCDLACMACASEMARSDGGDIGSRWIDESGCGVDRWLVVGALFAVGAVLS